MSDNDNNGNAKIRSGWSEHEILVCLINAIEKSGIQLDFKNIAYPQGRTSSGFTQKLAALKKTLKPELDAINSGQPLPESTPSKKKASDGTPKTTPRKRKAKNTGEDGEQTSSKKRGRPKKSAAVAAEAEEDIDEEINVKTEPEGDAGVGDEV